jgi:hypothetical protein
MDAAGAAAVVSAISGSIAIWRDRTMDAYEAFRKADVHLIF